MVSREGKVWGCGLRVWGLSRSSYPEASARIGGFVGTPLGQKLEVDAYLRSTGQPFISLALGVSRYLLIF